MRYVARCWLIEFFGNYTFIKNPQQRFDSAPLLLQAVLTSRAFRAPSTKKTIPERTDTCSRGSISGSPPPTDEL